MPFVDLNNSGQLWRKKIKNDDQLLFRIFKSAFFVGLLAAR